MNVSHFVRIVTSGEVNSRFSVTDALASATITTLAEGVRSESVRSLVSLVLGAGGGSERGPGWFPASSSGSSRPFWTQRLSSSSLLLAACSSALIVSAASGAWGLCTRAITEKLMASMRLFTGLKIVNANVRNTNAIQRLASECHSKSDSAGRRVEDDKDCVMLATVLLLVVEDVVTVQMSLPLLVLTRDMFVRLSRAANWSRRGAKSSAVKKMPAKMRQEAVIFAHTHTQFFMPLLQYYA